MMLVISVMRPRPEDWARLDRHGRPLPHQVLQGEDAGDDGIRLHREHLPRGAPGVGVGEVSDQEEVGTDTAQVAQGGEQLGVVEAAARLREEFKKNK